MRKLFVGRLSRRTRVADVEDVFDRYGRLTRCDVKYGQDTAYAFVDYENDQDAEDAIASENGRKLLGATMVVEWSKGHSKSLPIGRPSDECYRCGMRGHFGRDCRMSGFRSYGRGRSPVGRRSSRYSRSRSRSRSRSSRRSRSRRRSRSPRRSRTPRRSRSKSPRKSSVSPRRSGSKSPRRSPSPKRSPQGSPRKSRSRSPRSRSR